MELKKLVVFFKSLTLLYISSLCNKSRWFFCIENWLLFLYHSLLYVWSFCNKSRWFPPGYAFLASARTNFLNGLNCFPRGRELQYQQLSCCWLLSLCMFSSCSLSRNGQHPQKLLPLGLGPTLHPQQPLPLLLPVPAEQNSSDQLHG